MIEVFKWEYVAFLENPAYRSNEWEIYRLYTNNTGRKYIKREYGRISFIEDIKEDRWRLF